MYRSRCIRCHCGMFRLYHSVSTSAQFWKIPLTVASQDPASSGKSPFYIWKVLENSLKLWGLPFPFFVWSHENSRWENDVMYICCYLLLLVTCFLCSHTCSGCCTDCLWVVFLPSLPVESVADYALCHDCRHVRRLALKKNFSKF